MEILKLIQDNLAWWHFVILFFLLGIIFGKRKEWEYEAKLFTEGSEDIKGEVEVKKYHKEELNHIDVDIYSKNQPSKIAISIGGNEVLAFDILNNGGKLKLSDGRTIKRPSNVKKINKFRISEVNIEKPGNRTSVSVNVDGEVLTGQFFKD